MYSAVHGAIGVAIVTATFAITGNEVLSMAVGGFLAFLSHDPTDLLGEKGLGNGVFKYEIPAFIIMLLGGWLTGHLLLFYIGYTAANLMDLWDKKVYLSVFFPKKFPVRHDFPCHRRSPLINFSLKQTQIAGVISTIAIALISALVYFLQ
tara:strand:- start:465 stop:914 length:450 start_codon:yes stop_codon:yes gene_type:complete